MTKRKDLKNNKFAKKDWSINDTSTLLNNTNYKKFHTKKKRLQRKYDSRLFEFSTKRPPASINKWYLEEGQEQWRKYIKELNTLINKKDGDFQKFVWDIISNHNQMIMERKARGRQYGDYESYS